MKLISKTSINYVWLTVSVLLLSGFLLYGFLYIEVSEEIKEQLELQEKMVSAKLEQGDQVDFPLVKTQVVHTPALLRNAVFKDTLIYDPIQKKEEGYYLLRQARLIHGKTYLIEVMTTHIGWDGYSRTIAYTFIFITGMLISLGLLMNYFFNQKIWRPFKQNLEQLQSYSVSAQQDLVLVDSDIQEFKEMNLVISRLTHRANAEYQTLKEFTENASHEIQTPLSIVKSRLESMSQLSNNAEMVRFISDAKLAINRLSKVNKGLLLLAKLENQSFPDQNLLDLEPIILQQLHQLDDLIEYKQIDLAVKTECKFVEVSASLMDSLIGNLISNMLTHAPKGAQADILLTAEKLEFYNTGNVLPFDESRLFKRFGKGNPGSKGHGLGLPIVQEICKLYGWTIAYTYRHENHIFSITF